MTIADSRKRKPSRDPQQVMGGKAWYYEFPSFIEVIVPADPALEFGGVSNGVRIVRITKRMLKNSLRRMQ